MKRSYREAIRLLCAAAARPGGPTVSLPGRGRGGSRSAMLEMESRAPREPTADATDDAASMVTGDADGRCGNGATERPAG